MICIVVYPNMRGYVEKFKLLPWGYFIWIWFLCSIILINVSRTNISFSVDRLAMDHYEQIESPCVPCDWDGDPPPIMRKSDIVSPKHDVKCVYDEFARLFLTLFIINSCNSNPQNDACQYYKNALEGAISSDLYCLSCLDIWFSTFSYLHEK